jgi:hypothetical protein
MRKKLAGLRPRLIHRAKIALQKNTTLLVPLQDSSFVGGLHGVLAQEVRELRAKKARQALRIPVGDGSGRYAATIRARCAVNCIFDVLSDGLEPAFDKIVALQPRAKALIFIAPLFAESLDFDEAGDHASSISAEHSLGSLFDSDNRGVTDQLSLSIWLEKGAVRQRARHFENLLRLFPFSQRKQGQSTILVQAINATEPPLLERPVNGPVDVGEILTIFGDYSGDDVCYRLESWWDLWQFDRDWQLAPARATLSGFGPEFDNGAQLGVVHQEDLRIDFGVDAHFLPQGEAPGSAKLVESNIRSLLRLVHELDSAFPVRKRKLETESGENFADRLQQTLLASEGQ